MPYSMTGFGRAEKIFATRKYSVELKSVNSRYCDLNIRMPRILNFADTAVRKQITDALIRGKVDVFINYQDTSSECETITINEGLAKAYSDAAANIAAITGREDDLGVSRLASYPDVLQVSQTAVDEDVMGRELADTVAEALAGMNAMRKREGDALASNILTKISTLAGIRDEIEERSPAVIDGYRARLSARVDELLTSEQKEFYDEGRLAAEVALFADKCAVDEELTRLKSHFAQAYKILAGDGACGKQMDFLVQEINREVNTCGSKANDIEITNRVLAMKNTVEEIREQIQNLV
ncbi:MAG: YicC family protein [Clostridiales bacterium]|nr:YicC family protein [Clostridiales bacterium]